MEKAKLRALLELLEEFALSPSSAGGSWTERRDLLLAEATDNEKTALSEFISWFPEE